ncbi:S-adenosyl-L-methionine-dependent methyltransferase [Hypoxylon fragiforme]|uniref:S-adenosyl-L-methionine-dependent methyltransferase n=1 Tax=Hypoxylon fragiforme TaxID=63214 RepID=UPI0020C5BBDF|nr:S-adenosyl-L-methionine-dependent methyltransferase [Hypoxylon fragiforme]KAI2612533.1 S-adenosyl-L-methionine-dependent methyltransferase [Hypoxylon fragiforme]
MPSRTTSVTDSSIEPYSTENGGSIGELPVPDLDDDVSTEDFTSDCLSSRTTSYADRDSRILEHADGVETNHLDALSIYSPTRYLPQAVLYRIEYPYDDEDTMEEETLNSTRSINEELEYIMENGRRYRGSYFMPNDDDEQVRLQLINQVYLKTFDGELTSVPLEAPTHILDIGTAVGEWAIDMAELYPDCEVTGTDISNVFERRAPQNVYWEIDDAELEWERPANYYDLIHLRNMTGSFSDWQNIYRSAFTCLKPGGWIELLDFDDTRGMNSFHQQFQPGSVVHKLVHDAFEACDTYGRPMGVSHLEPRFLVNAGYVDVQLTEHAIPLRTEDGSTGKFWLLAILNGIEPTYLRLLTKYKGWKAEEVRRACDLIGQELMELALDPKRAKGFVIKVRVLKGRKPNPNSQSRWPRGPSHKSDYRTSGEVINTDMEEHNLTDEESGYCSTISHEPPSTLKSDLYDSDSEEIRPTDMKS